MSDNEIDGLPAVSPVITELDTEPVQSMLGLSELQSSCDTYISDQSDKEADEGQSENDKMKEKKRQSCVEHAVNEEKNCNSAETSFIAGTSQPSIDINSSMEVEANDSHHDMSVLMADRPDTKHCLEKEEGPNELFEANSPKVVKLKRQLSKTEIGSDGSPIPSKKSKIDLSETLNVSQEKHSLESQVSSEDKTILIEDSQEFSLRMDDVSNLRKENDEQSEDCTSWKSHSKPESEQVKLSQNLSSDPNLNLSLSSHPDLDKKSKNVDNSFENEKVISIKSSSQESGTLTPENLDLKSADSDSSGKRYQIREERLGHCVIMWSVEDNKVVYGELKQVSLLEDTVTGEKHGRLSVMSSTSTKTTSSSGSVGLPGPFTLPGYTRFSVLSSVSNSTSSSSETGCHPGWDGPFLKPPALQSKPVLVCGHCHAAFPHAEKTASPVVVNGGPNLSKIEEEIVQQRPTVNRKFKGKEAKESSNQSQSSNGFKEELSNANPQAASTPTPVKRTRKLKKKVAPIKKEVTTPAKPKLASPGHTPMPARSTRTPTTDPSNSDKGEAILAKWAGDGRYYPGWAKSAGTNNQTLVLFCDGQSKLMSSTWVVRANVITPGTLLLVTVDPSSAEYEECLVVQVDMEGHEPLFHVERDSVSKQVPFSSIALLESQVLELTTTELRKSHSVLNFNDLSLENIVSHPRKRSARKPFNEAASSSVKKKKKRLATPEPSTSNGQTFGGPDCIYMDTDSSTHSICSLNLRGKEMKPLDVEYSPPELEENSRLKQSHYRRNISIKSKKKLYEEEPEHLVKMMGPIPNKGSELFNGCVFLITYTDQVSLNLHLDIGTSGIEDTALSESVMPIWKDRLRMQIRSGGGKVYSSFSDLSSEELAKTYLLTDKPCNTPLYLQCLVNEIAIYSTSLIQKCCSQNRPFKEIIAMRSTKKLPAGYSLSRQCLVNPRSNQPLRGKTVLLALSCEQTLTSFWESILEKMGCSCEIYRGDSLGRKKFSVIVTDIDCDQDLVAEACKQKLPLVSLTWVQQCIINGDFRPPTEHSLYKYNYVSGQESPVY